MRMWGVNPKILCRKHLLGEHVEMHMFAGTINKGISLKGYIDKELVDPRLIVLRHNQLVEEMLSRGYNHKSPISLNKSDLPKGYVDEVASRKELLVRCRICRWRAFYYKHISNTKI